MHPAKYPGTCSCGRSVDEGDVIEYDFEARRIVGCAGCDFTGVKAADTKNIRNMRGIMGAVKRREAQRRKRWQRENP